MKVKLKGTGASVELSRKHFLAQGGEASIYVRDNMSFKIYTDPSHVTPFSKIKELSGITRPEVMKPEDILIDMSGKPIGCVMRFVQDATALCQVFTPAFRKRNGVTDSKVAQMVFNMQEVLSHVHEKGVLVVDLNEMNLLTGGKFEKVNWIDADSWQTPSFPATAIMDSVRDWNAKSFSKLTDWFSFAIVTFQLWMGIHPYKGKHPSVKSLKDRMVAGISVFNQEVAIPKMCPPMDTIPRPYRDWYRGILEEGKRTPPPDAIGAPSVLASKVKHITGGNNVQITLIDSFDSDITHFEVLGSHRLVFTIDGLRIGKTLYRSIDQASKAGLAPGGRVVLGDVVRGTVRLKDLSANKEIQIGMNGEAIMSYDGRLFFKAGDAIHEIMFMSMPDGSLRASSKQVGNTMPMATKVYDGVMFQDMLGAWYASVFPSAGRSLQFHVRDLDTWKVIDAKFDGGILMVVATRGGTYRRWTYVLKPDESGFSLREKGDINYSGINFVVLENGVCAQIDEEERLQLSSSKPLPGVKIVEDPVLSSNMKLYRCGTYVYFSQGRNLYRLSTRK